MKHIARALAAQGRGPDTTLVHMSEPEVRALAKLGGLTSLPRNPRTGLPEAGLLSMALPIAAMFIPGMQGVGMSMLAGGAGGALGATLEGGRKREVEQSALLGGLSGALAGATGGVAGAGSATASPGAAPALAPGSFGMPGGQIAMGSAPTAGPLGVQAGAAPIWDSAASTALPYSAPVPEAALASFNPAATAAAAPTASTTAAAPTWDQVAYSQGKNWVGAHPLAATGVGALGLANASVKAPPEPRRIRRAGRAHSGITNLTQGASSGAGEQMYFANNSINNYTEDPTTYTYGYAAGGEVNEGDNRPLFINPPKIPSRAQRDLNEGDNRPLFSSPLKIPSRAQRDLMEAQADQAAAQSALQAAQAAFAKPDPTTDPVAASLYDQHLIDLGWASADPTPTVKPDPTTTPAPTTPAPTTPAPTTPAPTTPAPTTPGGDPGFLPSAPVITPGTSAPSAMELLKDRYTIKNIAAPPRYTPINSGGIDSLVVDAARPIEQATRAPTYADYMQGADVSQTPFGSLDPVNAAVWTPQQQAAYIDSQNSGSAPGINFMDPNWAQSAIDSSPTMQAQLATTSVAKGGILSLKSRDKARANPLPPMFIKGAGDGMSDNVPAKIQGGRGRPDEPIRVADSEYIIPADVVSHLGNGSSSAGAKKLDQMNAKVRHARTGNSKQGKQIKAERYLPV